MDSNDPINFWHVSRIVENIGDSNLEIQFCIHRGPFFPCFWSECVILSLSWMLKSFDAKGLFVFLLVRSSGISVALDFIPNFYQCVFVVLMWRLTSFDAYKWLGGSFNRPIIYPHWDGSYITLNELHDISVIIIARYRGEKSKQVSRFGVDSKHLKKKQKKRSKLINYSSFGVQTSLTFGPLLLSS